MLFRSVLVERAGAPRTSGAVVLPLRELVRTSEVPAVRPGLPQP